MSLKMGWVRGPYRRGEGDSGSVGVGRLGITVQTRGGRFLLEGAGNEKMRNKVKRRSREEMSKVQKECEGEDVWKVRVG